MGLIQGFLTLTLLATLTTSAPTTQSPGVAASGSSDLSPSGPSPVLALPLVAEEITSSDVDSNVTVSPDTPTSVNVPEPVLSTAGQLESSTSSITSTDTSLPVVLSRDTPSGLTDKEISAVGDAIRNSLTNQLSSAAKQEPARTVLHFPIALEVDLVPDANSAAGKQRSL